MAFCGAPVSYFEKDGLKVRLGYVVLGEEFLASRRPLVLINGMGGTIIDWETLAAELSKTRCLLLYDHRGMGFSSYEGDPKELGISLPNYAQDMLDLISHLGWREVDLLGWSMGGVVIQQTLLMHKQYKDTLTIPYAIFGATSAKLPDGDPGALVQMGAMMENAQKYTGDRSSQEFKDSLRPGVSLYFDADFVAAHPSRVDMWVDRVSLGTKRAEVVGCQMAAGVGMNLAPRVNDFPQSTRILLIQGDKDRIVHPTEAKPYLGLPQLEVLAVGHKIGEVPNLDFGHAWWEYFTPKTWANVIDKFMGV